MNAHASAWKSPNALQTLWRAVPNFVFIRRPSQHRASGGYRGGAALYIAGAAADASFYATYEGPDAMELIRQRNLHGTVTTAKPVWAAEEAAQCTFLRDIVRSPFGLLPVLQPEVLAWNDRTVVRIAEGVYEERHMPEGTFDNGRLAILADALLDAGCDNEELIKHLGSAGPHVRGCWGIDLILNKS
jgi:hypothetical protein